MRGLTMPVARQTEQYRLILTIDRRELVFGSATFHSVEAAQSQVAAAVCEHVRRGDVAGVGLQRLAVNGTTAWQTIRQWDQTVVRRILAQKAGIAQPTPFVRGNNGRSSSRPTLDSTDELRAVLRAALGQPRPVRTSRRRKPADRGRPSHRSYRWHYIATAAIAVVTLIGLLMLETGGQLCMLLNEASPAPGTAAEIPVNPNPRTDAGQPNAPATDTLDNARPTTGG